MSSIVIYGFTAGAVATVNPDYSPQSVCSLGMRVVWGSLWAQAMAIRSRNRVL